MYTKELSPQNCSYATGSTYIPSGEKQVTDRYKPDFSVANL